MPHVSSVMLMCASDAPRYSCVLPTFSRNTNSARQAVLPRSFKAPRAGHTTLAVTLLAAAYLLGLPYFLDKLNKAHAYGKRLPAFYESRLLLPFDCYLRATLC